MSFLIFNFPLIFIFYLVRLHERRCRFVKKFSQNKNFFFASFSYRFQITIKFLVNCISKQFFSSVMFQSCSYLSLSNMKSSFHISVVHTIQLKKKKTYYVHLRLNLIYFLDDTKLFSLVFAFHIFVF